MLISKILGLSIDTLDTPVTRPLFRIHKRADIEFEGLIAFFIKIVLSNTEAPLEGCQGCQLTPLEF